jgi:copper(I)-binding protein
MKHFIPAFCVMVVAAVLISGPGRADNADRIAAGDLLITQGWARATPGGAKVGGGYLTIENKGTAPDRLIRASADFAEKVQLHEMAMNGGVMSMRPVEEGVVIDPGKTLKLAPGGYHLMLVGLKWPLRQGEKIGVTLEFERAGEVGVPLVVEGIGAQGPSNPDN